MHRIVAVKPLPGFKVLVRFSDYTEGTVDLSDLRGQGVFKTWDDPAVFNAAYVNPESRTVTWPGGIDLCPDVLYDDVTKKQPCQA